MTDMATLERANAIMKAEGGFWTECLARAEREYPSGCDYKVGDVTQKDCGHRVVAFLTVPDVPEAGRCSKHARICETAMEEEPLRYPETLADGCPGYSLRWVVEREVAA